MVDTVKINLRSGSLEFSAEGPEPLMRQWYERFLSETRDGDESKNSDHLFAPDPIERRLDRRASRWAFALRHDGVPFIRNIQGETVWMTLLMVLYAHLALRGERRITGSAILTSAKASGVEVDRVDRELDLWPAYVTSTGERRARRYCLTEAGAREVEEFVRIHFNGMNLIEEAGRKMDEEKQLEEERRARGES